MGDIEKLSRQIKKGFCYVLNDLNLEFYNGLLDKGFILYKKNGIIETVEPPGFGALILKFHDGKFTHGEIHKHFK